MLLKDFNWNDCKRRTIRAACYKSDHETPQVVNKRAYILSEILGAEGYDDFALTVREPNETSRDWIIKLFFKVGDLWIPSRAYINAGLVDIDLLKSSADKSKEDNINSYSGYCTNIIKPLLNQKKVWITKLELLPIVAAGDTTLLKRCVEHKRMIENMREKEREERHIEAMARIKKEQEIQLADFEAKKEKVIANMKSKNYVGNIDSYGENVIVKMCEDAGINIPLKTKGWMLDRSKFGGFYVNKDNNIIVYYDKKNCRCSQTVFRVLEELKMYYSEETEEDKQVMELFGFGGVKAEVTNND